MDSSHGISVPNRELMQPLGAYSRTSARRVEGVVKLNVRMGIGERLISLIFHCRMCKIQAAEKPDDVGMRLQAPQNVEFFCEHGVVVRSARSFQRNGAAAG